MKVMVLGGGFCQLNMIKRLKKDGHQIVLVDYLEKNPGSEYADEHITASTFDIPAVLEIAKTEKADAILTMGTDQPVLTASVAAKGTDLPFYVNPRTAVAVTNKLVMKSRFDEFGIPTVKHRFITRVFSNEDTEELKFPVVMKPVDSQGQRGIFKVGSPDEIRLHIEETFSYTTESKILIEEYYPNDEITVSGWVRDGNAKIISVVDRVTMEKDNRIGICIAHNYPSRHYEEYKKEIHELTQDIVDAFEIKDGPLYFQYLIGEQGVLVNEIAMRIGGAYEDLTIPVYSGIDILGYLIQYCFGDNPDYSKLDEYDIDKNNKHMSAQLFFVKPGRIASMTHLEELLNMEGVRGANYLVGRQDVIGDIENATARAGFFIVEGSDYADTMSKVGDVYDRLTILDEEGRNLVIRYSDYSGKYKFIRE